MDKTGQALRKMQEAAAIERRQQARFRIPGHGIQPEQLKVGVSIVRHGRRHDLIGALLDISESGFCARLQGDVPKSSLSEHAESVDWEIYSPLGLTCGLATVRRDQRHGDDLLLGLHIGKEKPILKPLVDYLREHWNLGCVSLDKRGQAQVHGRLHFDTARQLIHLTHRVKKIDLTHCSGIDGAGIGVIDLAVERGVALTGCAGDVRSMLTVAGICSRCHKLGQVTARAAGC